MGSNLVALSGEVTVKLPPQSRRGGRMQHLALLLARALEGEPFQALCAGSDGRDGPTDHAGAIVDGETASLARAKGIDLDQAIARFDSEAACRSLGIALPAFDSGTNLCDLVLVRVAR
ncbi:MAG: MOFRL family protein [Myxococcales bacterium]